MKHILILVALLAVAFYLGAKNPGLLSKVGL